MIRQQGTVVYSDGRREDFATLPIDWTRWERYALEHHYPPMPTDQGGFPIFTMQVYLAYSACTRAAARGNGGVAPGFETWQETVTDLELPDVPGFDPPTPAAVSADSSPSLQS